MQGIVVMMCFNVVQLFSLLQQVRHGSFAGPRLQCTQMAASQWSIDICSVLAGGPSTWHSAHDAHHIQMHQSPQHVPGRCTILPSATRCGKAIFFQYFM